ncbi:hypothetical protein Hamer_G026777 [Homarus americanus]|uniref:Uncharacterized protein n=1 Tax=Homarus americanus TaxID=6706 RepID=A0A8J5JHA6_HOMAM|nr:hypothetical protein Hamer_G026777 [Homarus americanus]
MLRARLGLMEVDFWWDTGATHPALRLVSPGAASPPPRPVTESSAAEHRGGVSAHHAWPPEAQLHYSNGVCWSPSGWCWTPVYPS